jgi:hypothetical protein
VSVCIVDLRSLRSLTTVGRLGADMRRAVAPSPAEGRPLTSVVGGSPASLSKKSKSSPCSSLVDRSGIRDRPGCTDKGETGD